MIRKKYNEQMGNYLTKLVQAQTNICVAEKHISNSDRIRSMTDEELADWYFDKFFPCAPYCSMLQDGCPEHDDCKICLLEWLKLERGDSDV